MTKRRTVGPELIRSRFSDVDPLSEKKLGKRRSHGRRYTRAEIDRALVLLKNQTAYAVAKTLKISRMLLQTWTDWNRPLNPAVYHGPKDPRVIVGKARIRAAKTGEDPIAALRAVWKELGLKYSSLKVYLSMERLPLPADFVIYGDPVSQMRCVAMWNEVTPTDPRPAAAAVPVPAAPSKPPAQGSVLLSRRRKAGYPFRVVKTTQRR